ncbi:hypothetical protein GCM10011365_00030 [Marinicella pacifica]|uniref:Lcl C-terminal domain-containing protein n=1 Tax=Marinicella pacifica TaxID=1171543 RepID=A0A917CCN7_9GAMM|nr:DUF1566 domain-containing protein [Marinicella pacifica]GGF83106.1 hypothetical protein GCM10011365_00030 [Marinicella pacifica]
MQSKTMTMIAILVLANFSYAQTDLIFKTSFEFVSKLNDTGITWSGEYPSGDLTECTNPASNPSPQDCNTGRDVTHNDGSDGHAGFSFTKLDANGVPLVDQSVDYGTQTWACVRDNVTGLVWEVKTTTAGIHHQDNTYRWGGITAIGLGHPDAEGTYYDDWDVLVNGSNSETLCGFDNWRVPTIDELTGLANYGTFNPAIDTDYFPNTVSSGFWSSLPFAGNDYAASIVHFGGGNGYNDPRGISSRVRLVRSPGQ